jgi:hypothetical protein
MGSVRRVDFAARKVCDRTAWVLILSVALVHSLCLAAPCAGASPLHDREISLLRTSWFWSSVPPGSPSLVSDHARINWYAPHLLTLERDLNPTLTADDGAEDVHPVLEIDIHAPTGQPAIDSSDWTGMVQALDRTGLDFSGLQAVELWVNDFRVDHTVTAGTLRLALGRFSEDAFWDPKNPPNLVLDTEDKNRDGLLSRLDPQDVDYAIFDEDTGLDGLHDPQEPGYTDSNSDPNADDYRYSLATPDEHSRINNLERNALDDPDARPDTEDLNLDGGLDLSEDYHEVRIDLADTNFVLVDVSRDYTNYPIVANGNGWRLFRLPLGAFQPVGQPDWSRVETIRLVMEGMQDPLRLQIGGIRLVGIPAPPSGSRIILHQNRPNPFNPATVIEYELASDERVVLEVYNVAGRKIATLVDRIQTAGAHRLTLPGRDDHGRSVPSGVYLYRLRTPAREATRRMVLLK